MPKLELKEFQEKAINKVLNLVKEKEKVIFQSPTGSGKTIMIAKIVEKFLQNYNKDFFQNTTVIYISLSSGKLYHQGYKKISKLLEEKFVEGFKTIHIGTISGEKDEIKKHNYIQGIEEFKVNTMYFMGWGTLTKNSKSFKEGEEDNIFNIIRRTKASGRKIFLIIDEAHRENPRISKNFASHERIEFLNELSPNKELWMSATFLSLKKPINPDYIVSSNEVKSEGIIKQNVIINDEMDSKWNDDSANKKLIEGALKKRLEIIESINKTGKKFNPLILIQIPDASPKFGEIKINDYYLKLIDDIFSARGLKLGYDYGVYQSEVKTNQKQEIESMVSPLQAIVFKQAIATGWDVPRASILVKLRKPSSKTESFEIQTLGRVLRNPFLRVYSTGGKINGNDVENLNNAFVFTNDKDYSSYIKDVNENVVKNVWEKDLFQISEKAKNMKLKLNLLNLKNIDAAAWLSVVNGVKVDAEFRNKISIKIDEYNSRATQIIAKSESLDGASLSDGKIDVQTKNQLEFSGTSINNKEDMYYIYIQFLQAIGGSKIVESIVKELANEDEKYDIKTWFNYFSNEYKKTFEKEKSLEEIFNEKMYKIIKNNINYYVWEEFSLSEKIEYNSDNLVKILNEFEEEHLINSYLYKAEITKNSYESILDSAQEYFLYKWFDGFKWNMKEKSKFHLFRNKTNPMNSFFIEYIDISSMKKRKFFPDFILTTDNKIIILEVKGIGRNNIDSKAELKLLSLSNNLNKIKKEKELYLYKVGSLTMLNKENDLECFEYVDGKISEPFKLEEFKNKILCINDLK